MLIWNLNNFKLLLMFIVQKPACYPLFSLPSMLAISLMDEFLLSCYNMSVWSWSHKELLAFGNKSDILLIKRPKGVSPVTDEEILSVCLSAPIFFFLRFFSPLLPPIRSSSSSSSFTSFSSTAFSPSSASSSSSSSSASLVPPHKAVVKRLMTDVPFGVLLSGGLDSSLVAAVASRHLAEAKVARQWGSQLHTFCIGLKGSPDLRAAREVADYLGTYHHEFHFTVQEGIDALEEVIHHIETYDVTTIRASTPMFLMSRKIKSLGVKMVLSGEGSDEIFGGYLYFHKAPNKEEFHQETCRKIKALHLYDCLRANKSTSAWGLEARVPFLDKDFLNVAMAIDPKWKMIRPDLGRIEKWILRNAFDDEKNPYLPKPILYRQKEQFSDGVGYNWIDGLKDHANQHVSDAMLMHASFVYPENTPTTKEAYYYRTVFEKFYPKNAARATVPGGPSVACSTAKAVEWDATWSKNLDPSGRAALGVHVAAYEEEAQEKSSAQISTSPDAFLPKQTVTELAATAAVI